MLFVAGALLVVHRCDNGGSVVADSNGATDPFEVATSAELDKDIILVIGTVLQGLVNLGINQVSIVLLQSLVLSLLFLFFIGGELP